MTVGILSIFFHGTSPVSMITWDIWSPIKILLMNEWKNLLF